MSNFDTDPRQLILEAAELSGLLKEVAALIWFVNKHEPTGRNAGRFPQRELLEQLVDAFDDHIGAPSSVVEHVYFGGRDGPDISPAPGTEDEAAFESFYAKFCVLKHKLPTKEAFVAELLQRNPELRLETLPNGEQLMEHGHNYIAAARAYLDDLEFKLITDAERLDFFKLENGSEMKNPFPTKEAFVSELELRCPEMHLELRDQIQQLWADYLTWKEQ